MTFPEGYEQEGDGERAFVESTLRQYSFIAYDQIAPVFIGDESHDLRERFKVEVVQDENQDRDCVPVARYTPNKKAISLIIDADIVMNYASELTDEMHHDVEEADVARILIGAGVARTILGYKTTSADITTEAKRNRYMELLCSKTRLWDEADLFDAEYDTNLRQAVERLGDEQISQINFLRFAFGASLRYMSDVSQLQQSLVKRQREELALLESGRAATLRFNLGWLDSANAFAIYDDELPEIEFASSFPMSPAEEQEFIDY